MKIFKFGLTGLFLFLACFATTNAFAQADKTGLDLRVGVSVPYYKGASVSFNFGEGISAKANALEAVGVGLDVSVIYRWTNFGLGIEQLVGGIFALDDAISAQANTDEGAGEVSYFKKGDGAFYGATYFMLKEYIPIGSAHLITIGQGIGASYGAKLDNKRLYSSDSDAAFSVKADLGYTYFTMDTYGVGLNLEYQANLAFGNGISYSWTFIPQVFFNMVF